MSKHTCSQIDELRHTQTHLYTPPREKTQMDRPIDPNTHEKAPDVKASKIHSDKRMENILAHKHRYTHVCREFN